MSFLEETRQLFAYHRKWTSRFAEHDVHNVFEKAVRDLEAEGMTGLPGKRVLDLGCGALFPVALQFAASGATVTAMDVRYVRPDFLPLAIVRAFSHDGVKPAAKLMIRRVFFGSRYYGALEGAAGKQLRAHRSEIAFSTADPAGGEYPLPSGSFDLIASNAVLEHVPDVPKFAREVKRLLVPGGYFYAIIHNFYSLSGGHSPEWAYPDTDPSDRVPAWDHLRDQSFPVSTYLNELRPDEYRQALASELDVLVFEGRDRVHDPGGPEGERFLDTDVAAELSRFPRKLLLTRLWCAVCRRREED